MKSEGTSTCQACGAQVPAGLDFCPVCALRGALDEARETSALDVNPTHSSPASRFDHYQLLTREDGTPFELGRGAMGVTYKAIDINLRCAVALKVIGARFIGDEAARRRFVREARAAASVRHPNVASVFHLGQSGAGYFYAMEYVEGETLENLIKRCGRLEPKIALEIKRNESPLCQIERDQDAHSRGRRRVASCPLPRLSGIVVLLAASIEGVG